MLVVCICMQVDETWINYILLNVMVGHTVPYSGSLLSLTFTMKYKLRTLHSIATLWYCWGWKSRWGGAEEREKELYNWMGASVQLYNSFFLPFTPSILPFSDCHPALSNVEASSHSKICYIYFNKTLLINARLYACKHYFLSLPSSLSASVYLAPILNHVMYYLT